MPDDALDRVLQLVAEGRLTAEEAGPILDALDAREPATTDDPRPAAASATTPVADPAGPSASRSTRAAARSSTCGCRWPWAVPR